MSSPSCLRLLMTVLTSTTWDEWWNMYDTPVKMSSSSRWIHFPGSKRRLFLLSCLILCGRGGGWGGEGSLLQPPTLVKTLKGLFVILRLREGGWHFLLAVEAHLAVPSAPFISCVLLSWNGTKLAGAYRNSQGILVRRRVRAFSDRCALVVWDRRITLLHTFTQEVEARR